MSGASSNSNNPRDRRKSTTNSSSHNSSSKRTSAQSASSSSSSSRRSSASSERPSVKGGTSSRNPRATHSRKEAQAAPAQTKANKPRTARPTTTAARNTVSRNQRSASSSRSNSPYPKMGGATRPVAQQGTFPVMPSKKRPKGKKIAIACAVVVVILAAVVGGIGFTAYGQAKELKSQADVLLKDIESVTAGIKSNDFDAAANAAVNVKNETADMSEELKEGVWPLLSVLPVYGEDVKNVGVLIDTLNNVATDALVPLTVALQTTPLSDLITADKSVNIEAMNTLLAALQKAAPSMQEAMDTLEDMPAFHLDQLQQKIGPATEKLENVNDIFQKASELAPIMGMLLGAEGNRTYLIAAQNSAELRAAGGFPGAIGLLTIDNGKISMEDFTRVYDALPGEPPASAAITDTERQLFDSSADHLSRLNDLGMIPDFARVAEIWAQAYEETHGVHVDGVISVTPSVVQHLLGATSAITLSDGTTLDGKNGTKVLQHDLYWKYLSGTSTSEANDLVDALFAEAAAKAFDGVFNNMSAGTLRKVVSLLFDDMDTREFMVWLTDPDEQTRMALLDCSGELNDDPAAPELGIFTTIENPSKLGWYLDVDTQVGEGVKNADGTTSYAVTTTVYNACTSEEAATGGRYIMGSFTDLVPGDSAPWIYFAGPAGGNITDFQASNSPAIIEGTYEDLQFIKISGSLAPGQSATYTYTVTVSAAAQDPLEVISTPLLTKYR